MNVKDYLNSLIHRESLAEFKTKYPSHISDAEKAYAEFEAVLKEVRKAGGEQLEAIKKVEVPFVHAQNELQKVADLSKKDWVKKEGVDAEVFEKAKTDYTNASSEFEKFLKGEEKVTLADKKEVGVSEELKTAYGNASEAVEKVKGKMDSMLSMAKVEGYGKAAKHNLSKLNPFGKERPKANSTELALRGGSIVVGAAMTVDAFARSKKKDGEERSGAGRFVEGLAGVGIGAAGILTGHAR